VRVSVVSYMKDSNKDRRFDSNKSINVHTGEMKNVLSTCLNFFEILHSCSSHPFLRSFPSPILCPHCFSFHRSHAFPLSLHTCHILCIGRLLLHTLHWLPLAPHESCYPAYLILCIGHLLLLRSHAFPLSLHKCCILHGLALLHTTYFALAASCSSGVMLSRLALLCATFFAMDAPNLFILEASVSSLVSLSISNKLQPIIINACC
jgi:hypothetical protein